MAELGARRDLESLGRRRHRVGVVRGVACPEVRAADRRHLDGRAELAGGELDDAIASFQSAVESNAENVYAWNNLGYALMRNKQWGDAVTALEHAVDADKVEPYMWNNLGMAYEHLDRLDDAREAYEEGAAAGSTAAKDNRERLEGVESIAMMEPAE